ncbi:hypothetical protein L9Z73_21245, partial [Pseudomonas sp. TNT11]|nr:hypothetical protein [Pseudomonas emilianonis]
MTDSTNANARLLWRGRLLPLESEALPGFFGAAAQPNGSKLPRHTSGVGKGAKALAMVLCGVLLSACAVGPDYTRPAVIEPAQF